MWLPPPSQSVSRQGYLPGQLYDLNTPYGSKQELVSLLQTLRAAGIAPLADIVINHRCADQQDDSGQWNIFTCAFRFKFMLSSTVYHPIHLLVTYHRAVRFTKACSCTECPTLSSCKRFLSVTPRCVSRAVPQHRIQTCVPC